MKPKKLMLMLLTAAMLLTTLAACGGNTEPAATTLVSDTEAVADTTEAVLEVETESESTTERATETEYETEEDTAVATDTEAEYKTEFESETEKYLGVNILTDPTFQNGFKLINTNEAGGGVAKLLPGRDGSTDNPSWLIAQWWNNNLLQNGTEVITDTTYSITDPSKMVGVDWEKGMLTLKLDASRELTAANTTQWPHLLLEQAIPETPLKDAESVTAAITFTIVESEDRRGGPGLHAQFSWFIYIADRNPESEGYGNFLWFGLNLFNSNTVGTSLYHAQDTAGGPGNFIYSLGSASFLDKRLWMGRPSEVECDILPHIEAALETAHRYGFMIGTDLEDVSITGMNIGWEIFDRWNETVTIEKMGIYVK